LKLDGEFAESASGHKPILASPLDVSVKRVYSPPNLPGWKAEHGGELPDGMKVLIGCHGFPLRVELLATHTRETDLAALVVL
jgi:hypothetical protein